MKKALKEEYRIKPNDIQVTNIKCEGLRYIDTSARRTTSVCAMDMTGITSRLYPRHTSTPGNMLNSTQQYPYCGMIPWHQKQFKEYLDEFQTEEDEEILTDEKKKLQLYDWQRKAELALLSQNNKQILWIYDQEGGKLRKIKLR